MINYEVVYPPYLINGQDTIVILLPRKTNGLLDPDPYNSILYWIWCIFHVFCLIIYDRRSRPNKIVICHCVAQESRATLDVSNRRVWPKWTYTTIVRIVIRLHPSLNSNAFCLEQAIFCSENFKTWILALDYLCLTTTSSCSLLKSFLEPHTLTSLSYAYFGSFERLWRNSAVFNYWTPLKPTYRIAYHGQFKNTEYQIAKKRGGFYTIYLVFVTEIIYFHIDYQYLFIIIIVSYLEFSGGPSLIAFQLSLHQVCLTHCLSASFSKSAYFWSSHTFSSSTLSPFYISSDDPSISILAVLFCDRYLLFSCPLWSRYFAFGPVVEYLA